VKQLILDEHISSVKNLQVPAAIQMMNKMVSYDLFILFGGDGFHEKPINAWLKIDIEEKKKKRGPSGFLRKCIERDIMIKEMVLISEDIRARMSRWCKERGSLTCMVSCLGGVVRLA